MQKEAIYQKERAKLLEIFADVDPATLALVEGLIDEAAYLKATNESLKSSMAETGMVRIHPQHPSLQKPVETARQYLKNVNSYAVIIKALNGIKQRNVVEADDDFDDFMGGKDV